MALSIDGDNLLDLPEGVNRPTSVRTGNVILEQPRRRTVMLLKDATQYSSEIL
jgi:hypothetical protein